MPCFSRISADVDLSDRLRRAMQHNWCYRTDAPSFGIRESIQESNCESLQEGCIGVIIPL